MTIKERRAKWIEALRSGKYEQTTGVLRRTFLNDNDTPNGYGFCCLGVACDVVKYEVKGSWNNGNFFIYTDDNGDRWTLDTGLGARLQEFLGITYDQHETLVFLNDSKGCDFNTIARAIEAFAELPDRLFPDSED